MEGYALGRLKCVAGVEDRRKLEVEEREELVSSDGSIKGVNNDNLEGAAHGTEYGIRQVTDG